MRTPRKSHTLRNVLLGAGAILVVGAAAIIVASAALDPARLQDELKAAILRSTGRELTVAGGVHLRMGLSPRFEADDIALANIPGASRPQMLTAKSLTAQLALLPLLSGDAVISSLSLQDPDVILERGTDGAANWQFAPARHALFQPHGASGSGGDAHQVQVRTIRVSGGQVRWQPGAGPGITLHITSMEMTADSRDSPMNLAVAGTQNGVPVSLKGAFGSLQRLQGGPVSALAGAWPLMIDATAAGASAHLEGGVNHPDQARGYNLRLTLNAPSLNTLTPLLPFGNLPPLADVNATAVLQDGSQGELRTSQVSLHAGESDLGSWAPGLAIKQLAVSAPGPGQLVQMNVDGTYQQLPLRVAGTAMQPDVVGSGGPIQVTFSAQAAGATASAHGTLPPSLNAPGIDLAVTAHAPDVSALSPLIGRTLPPAHEVNLAAKLGDAGVKLRGIAIRDLAISSSLGDLAGQLTVDWSPRASVTGDLTSQVLNLDAIAGTGNGIVPAVWPAPADNGQVRTPPPAPIPPAPIPPAPVPPAPPAASPGTAATPANTLPLAFLRNTDADLTIAIGDLTADGQRLQDLQAHLQLTDGKLALNPFRAQSAEGAIIGAASIDATSDDPPIAVTLRSPAISAEALAGLLNTRGGAHGTMQVDAQLSGTGQTAQAIKSTLTGHLGIAMVNGQVDDSLIQALLGDALNTAGIPSVGGGTSQVRCFAGRLDFDAGIGTIRALSVDTSKLVLDGTGKIDLQAQTADLHLRPRLRLGFTQVAAPVSLHGTLGDLKATLDPVLDGGRVGIAIGGGQAPSNCATQLALARGGLGGPMPAAAPPDQGLTIRKPKDLLQGLFH